MSKMPSERERVVPYSGKPATEISTPGSGSPLWSMTAPRTMAIRRVSNASGSAPCCSGSSPEYRNAALSLTVLATLRSSAGASSQRLSESRQSASLQSVWPSPSLSAPSLQSVSSSPPASVGISAPPLEAEPSGFGSPPQPAERPSANRPTTNLGHLHTRGAIRTDSTKQNQPLHTISRFVSKISWRPTLQPMRRRASEPKGCP